MSQIVIQLNAPTNNPYPQQQQQFPQQQQQFPQQQFPQQQMGGFNQMPMQQQFPQQQMMMPQQQQQQHPHGVMINGKLKQTGYQRLESRDGIFVKQKIDWTEAMSGCEAENVYQVFGLNKEGEAKGKPIFVCKEKSGCCSRQFCSNEWRALKVGINTWDEDFNELMNEPFCKIDRECACVCMCLNRPTMKVSYCGDKGEEFIGKVVDPWNCMNLILHVHDGESGNVKYKVAGSCCQLGIWCKMPCDPCQTVEFDITNQGGDKVSTLTKKTAGCLQSQLTSASNFTVMFPPKSTKEDRVLLLAAAIFLDFRYFEEKGGKKPPKGGVMIINGD